MPARQDQTLQIFLIVFIFLFLVSAVVAYLGWRGYSDAEQRNVALTTQKNDVTTQRDNIQTENEDYREMMGFGRGDNSQDVKTAFEEDMKSRGAGVADEGSRSYRKVLETVFSQAQELAKSEASKIEQVKDLNNRLQAVEVAAKKQIDQYDKQRQDAEAALANERNTFKEDRAALEQNKSDLMKTVEDQKTAFETKLAQFAAEKAEHDKKVEELERSVAIFKEQRRDEPGSFEIADGRVSWVNQNGTVWINLGTADSLRRQVTFSVFDADQHDADKATKKGSIEVTRLLGEHMAEARITEDDATNPILTGDMIYSQVWHRGKQLHFALTGVIDIDGDGRSDMQLARELVQLNGGVVDAHLNDDGSIEGEITATTRYLVLGELSEAPSQGRMQESWHAMNQQSNSLGVETITLSEFLNEMGYKPQDRTVRLGPGASARDFPARADDNSGRSAPAFRQRTPFRAAPTSTPTPQ